MNLTWNIDLPPRNEEEDPLQSVVIWDVNKLTGILDASFIWNRVECYGRRTNSLDMWYDGIFYEEVIWENKDGIWEIDSSAAISLMQAAERCRLRDGKCYTSTSCSGVTDRLDRLSNPQSQQRTLPKSDSQPLLVPGRQSFERKVGAPFRRYRTPSIAGIGKGRSGSSRLLCLMSSLWPHYYDAGFIPHALTGHGNSVTIEKAFHEGKYSCKTGPFKLWSAKRWIKAIRQYHAIHCRGCNKAPAHKSLRKRVPDSSNEVELQINSSNLCMYVPTTATLTYTNITETVVSTSSKSNTNEVILLPPHFKKGPTTHTCIFMDPQTVNINGRYMDSFKYTGFDIFTFFPAMQKMIMLTCIIRRMIQMMMIIWIKLMV